MSDGTRASIIKKGRRDLLGSLRMYYPVEAEYTDLALTVPTVEEPHFRVDLSYLIDKGYLLWTNRKPNAIWQGREYLLTAKGVEVADRILTDPALEP